ncbi:MAG: c-type cytochrome [Rhodoferax sp.]|nr:c-type cytochrome [Rhodoferax sp.]
MPSVSNRLWGVAGAVALLAACQEAPPVPTSADLQRAEQTLPSDAQLAQKYARSCHTCHANRASTAPLARFAADWRPRLRQGSAVLLGHVRDGFNGMPARGFCNDCSDQDFEALTAFMSTPANKD